MTPKNLDGTAIGFVSLGFATVAATLLRHWAPGGHEAALQTVAALGSLMAGILEYFAGRTFYLTFFVSMSAFWASYASYASVPSLTSAASNGLAGLGSLSSLTLSSVTNLPSPPSPVSTFNDEAPYLLVWALFSLIMFAASFRTNKVITAALGGQALWFAARGIILMITSSSIEKVLTSVLAIPLGLAWLYLGYGSLIRAVYPAHPLRTGAWKKPVASSVL